MNSKIKELKMKAKIMGYSIEVEGNNWIIVRNGAIHSYYSFVDGKLEKIDYDGIYSIRGSCRYIAATKQSRVDVIDKKSIIQCSLRDNTIEYIVGNRMIIKSTNGGVIRVIDMDCMLLSKTTVYNGTVWINGDTILIVGVAGWGEKYIISYKNEEKIIGKVELTDAVYICRSTIIVRDGSGVKVLNFNMDTKIVVIDGVIKFIGDYIIVYDNYEVEIYKSKVCKSIYIK